VATQRAYIFAWRDTDPASTIIRRARPDEAALLSVLALRSKAHWGYDDAFMAACRADLTLSPDEIATTAVYVLEAVGQVVGFHQVRGDQEEAELTNLFIAPPAIGAWHGARLWHHAALLAAAQGHRALTVQSDPHAEGFYRAMGMATVGETPSTAIPGRVLPQMRIAL